MGIPSKIMLGLLRPGLIAGVMLTMTDLVLDLSAQQ